jgi:hypothetical protein
VDPVGATIASICPGPSLRAEPPLGGPALGSKSRQRQMLDPNLGMCEQVGLTVGQRDELLGHGSASGQAHDATSGFAAHIQGMPR